VRSCGRLAALALAGLAVLARADAADAPDARSVVPARSIAPLPPAAAPRGPLRVGIYLFSIQELDFAKHAFQPRFEIWWRWHGDDFDPLTTLQVVGARSMNVVPEDRRKLPDGENYLVARVEAVINQALDTGAFPFDSHRLSIQIESPYEDDYVQFDVDTESSVLDPDAFSPGWRLGEFRIREVRIAYPTSFGLKERSGDRYSRIIVDVVAERLGWRVAVDYFIGFIVCALLCMLGYLINPRLLAVRTSLVTAATFAAVGNKYVINALTETSSTARLANVAVVTSFAMVLLLMVTSIACERLIEGGSVARAVRLNRNVGLAASIGYVGVIAFFLLRALAGAAG
jgi:hypothetical protein